MDINVLRSAVTLCAFVLFVAIVLWAYRPSKRGQFELKPTDDGGTRLVGTTWYQHGLLPESYWRLWSDAVLHRIHARVLNHIRSLAEAESSRR